MMYQHIPTRFSTFRSGTARTDFDRRLFRIIEQAKGQPTRTYIILNNQGLNVSFQKAFENAAPDLVADAWDFVERSLEVGELWVYISRQFHHPFATALYRVAGDLHAPEFAVKAITGAMPDSRHTIDFLVALAARAEQLQEDAGDDEVPTRMVFCFRPSDHDFAADFFYGDLQPGIPDDEIVPDITLYEQWENRLRATGTDAADL